MKRAIIFLSMLVMVGVSSSRAQSGKTFGGFGYYSAGMQFMLPNDINDYLPSSLPEVSFSRFTDAGGGFGVFYNLIIGAEAGNYTGGSFVNGSTKVDLSGEYGAVKVGYMVFKKKGFWLYPMLGYGTNTLNLYIHGTELTRTFNDLASNPQVATNLVYTNHTATFSLAGQYFVFGSKSENNSSGLAVGFEIGYQLPPLKHGEWTYDNGPVMDGPLFDLSGLFMRMSVGGGGLMLK